MPVEAEPVFIIGVGDGVYKLGPNEDSLTIAGALLSHEFVLRKIENESGADMGDYTKCSVKLVSDDPIQNGLRYYFVYERNDLFRVMAVIKKAGKVILYPGYYDVRSFEIADYGGNVLMRVFEDGSVEFTDAITEGDVELFREISSKLILNSSDEVIELLEDLI